MSSSLHVSLLRHGHTQSGPVYRGQIDVALSDRGWQQMCDASADLTPDKIVSSPLMRCMAFAQSMDAAAIADERFMEINFGAWDGKLRDEVWQESPDLVKAFWADPMRQAPPNGESLAQLQARTNVALQEHIHIALQEQCKHLLIISHSGVMRALLGKILHMSPLGLFNLHFPYAGLVNLQVATFIDAQSHQQSQQVSLDFGTSPHVR